MRWSLEPARAVGAPAAVLLAVLGPLAWHWSAGRTLAWFDTKALYAPARSLIAEALRAGELPLWNPYGGLGLPVLAEAVHGVLHPVSLLAAAAFPGDAIDPLIAGYVACAAVGAWILARALGASASAAALAGVAYGLSGFVLSMCGNLVFLAGAGSLPWGAAGLWRAGRGRPLDLLAGGGGVALCALSGDIQATVAAGVLGLMLATGAQGWRGAGRALLAGLLGGLLAGVQLAPSWVHLARTDRASPLAADLSLWAFDPVRFVELVAPGLLLRPADGFDSALYRALGSGGGRVLPFAASVFVGAPVLLLAAAATGRRGPSRPLAVAALAGLWLAAGHHLGAAALLRPVPVLGAFRFAEKWVGPLTLLLCALAALGADRLLEDRPTARRWAHRAGAAGALLLLASAGLAWSASPPGWWGTSGVGLAARLGAGLLAAAGGAVGLAGALRVAASGHRRLAWSLLLLLTWGEAAAASWLALRPGAVEARAGVPAAPGVVAAPGAPAPRVVNEAYLPDRPPQAVGWDVFDQEAFDGQAISSPNYNVAQRVDNVDVFTGLQSRRWLAVRQAFALDWPVAARRFSASHLLVPPAGPGEEAPAVPGGRLVGVDGRTGASVWEVPHRRWASFTPRVVTRSDPESALRALSDLRAAGDPGAVVESSTPWPTAPGRVLSAVRGREWLRVEAESSSGAVLVINEAWWPGWRATLDGVEVPLAPADVLVRAVAWPAGRHVLVMRYRPDELRLGGWLTGAGLLAALALAVAEALRRRRPHRPGAAGGAGIRRAAPAGGDGVP